MSTEMPQSIAAYFAGSNAHDAAACAGCFTDDAIVRDEGHDRKGVADIQAWKQETIEKYRMHVDILDVSAAGDISTVTGRVSGNFRGSPVDLRYAFTLSGGKIARLEIVP